MRTSFIPPPPVKKSSNGLPNPPPPPNGPPPGPPPEAACSKASCPTYQITHSKEGQAFIYASSNIYVYI